MARDDLIQVSAKARTDEDMMRIALGEARLAWAADEVPVGAIVVIDGEVKGRGHNSVVSASDPSAHAEILALRAAARAVGNYRLAGASLYSTIEPCAMCAGAIVHARIARLIYGAGDVKAGAVRTHFGICTSEFLNHRVEVQEGVLENECRLMLVSFFRMRRGGARELMNDERELMIDE